MPSPKRSFDFLNGYLLNEIVVLVTFSECNYLPQARGDSGVSTVDIAEACKKRKPGINFTKTENMSGY